MIHQYKNNGYNIVLDVNSGSVHVVDDLVYDAIPLVEEVLKSGVSEAETLAAAIEACKELPCSQEEVAEVCEELLALKEAGQLYTEDIYKDYIIDFKKRQTVVKAL